MKIKDINVADAYQGKNNSETKGIGTSLYQKLEKQVPVGTELYFTENQALGFWKKMGFQERSSPDSPNGKEYYKRVYY